MGDHMTTVTVMTPCFNEEAGIRECYEAVKRVFDEELPDIQRVHLFIDNCSTDRTVEVLREIADVDPQVRVIVNSRNFGLSRSPYHGFLEMEGDAVVPLVADLQTPPEVIPEMITKWRSGADSVIAVRREMEVGLVTKWWRNLYYWLLRVFTGNDEASHFIGFGLFSRRIVDVMRLMDDPAPYFRGLVFEVGFPHDFVYYDEPRRAHGKSRHRFFDKFELAALGLVSSTSRPLYLLTLVGALVGALSVCSSVVYLLAKLIWWDQIPVGITPLLLATGLLGGVQLFTLGMLGLYLDVILKYVKRRPLVVEKARIGFAPSSEAGQ